MHRCELSSPPYSEVPISYSDGVVPGTCCLGRLRHLRCSLTGFAPPRGPGPLATHGSRPSSCFSSLKYTSFSFSYCSHSFCTSGSLCPSSSCGWGMGEDKVRPFDCSLNKTKEGAGNLCVPTHLAKQCSVVQHVCVAAVWTPACRLHQLLNMLFLLERKGRLEDGATGRVEFPSGPE